MIPELSGEELSGIGLWTICCHFAHFLGKEEEVTFDAGFMWQETKRELKEQKIGDHADLCSAC